MLKSFRERTHSVGVVGHIQIGRIAKTGWGSMGQPIDHFIITTHNKDEDGKSFCLDHALMARLFPMGPGAERSHLGDFAKVRRLRVYAGADVAQGSCKVDRGLYIGASRSCYSEDGETASWYTGKDSKNHLPPAMAKLRTDPEEKGDRVTVRCLEGQCPLVIDPLFKVKADGSKGTVWKCKVRGTMRFRIEGAGAGLYNFDTTSEPSSEAIWAMLEWLERETGGNMGGVPMDLMMTQHSTEHGKPCWRTNLQVACSRQEVMARALKLKQLREALHINVDPAPDIERPLEDASFAAGFHGLDDADDPTAAPAQSAPQNAPQADEGRVAAPPPAAAPEHPSAAGPQSPPAPAAGPTLAAFRQAIGAALKRTESQPWTADQVARLLAHLTGGTGKRADAVPEEKRAAAIRRLAGPPPADTQAAPPPPAASSPPPSGPVPDGEASDNDKMAVLDLNLTIPQIKELAPGFDPSRPLTAEVAKAVLAKYGS